MNKVFQIVFFSIVKVILGNDSWNIFSINNSKLIPEDDENLFCDINELLQDTINNIFTFLNLDKHFISQYETGLLLSIHASLKKISESKYHLYKDVTNAGRLDLIYHDLKNTSLFKLDKIIDEFMGKNFSVKINNMRNISNIKLDTISMEIPDNSEEAYVFLRKYLCNVQNIELSDLTKPSKIIREIFERHKKFKEAQRNNFKVWKPLNSNESMKSNARRVFKGNQVKIKKFPFVASIHVKNKFICTGAVISRNMIISAANCFHEVFYNPKFLQDHPHAIFIRVGSEYPNSFGESIEATNVFIHPNYEAATLEDNIAIVQIKKHVHLKKKNRKIRRIEFQRMKGGLPTSVHEVLLLGWGDKEDNNGQLSYSHLKLYKLKDCINIYPKYVSEKNFCAGYSGKGAGACQRDVGGPAVVSNVLVGVVSFGPPICGTSHSPTVFTNIGHYVSWIESVVERTQGISVATTADHSNYLNQPLFSELNLRQYPKPPQQNFYTMSASILQYPESISLLSNVLREIMLHSAHMHSENSFGVQPNAGLWNTTTMTSTTLAHGSVSPPNQIDRILPFRFNEFARTRQSDGTQITMSTNQGPFFKISRKPLHFYTKYDNFSVADKPENVRYITEASNKNLDKEETSSSDSENYESSEEVGLSIQVPSTSLPPITRHREGRMALYEPQSYDMVTMQNTKSAPDFEIPGRPFQENPANVIKNFVKNKLVPMGSQIGILESNFREEAEEFLVQNYLRERLNPMNQQNSLLSTVPSFKKEEEYADLFLGKKYQKSLNDAEKIRHDSNELVLLLLKHSTVRNKKYRYQVADRDIFTDSYVTGLSSTIQISKRLKRLKNVGLQWDQKFIIKENQKTTRAYEQLTRRLSQKNKFLNGKRGLFLAMKKRKQLLKERQNTIEEEITPKRFSEVSAKRLKKYFKHTPFLKFVTRPSRNVAMKRAVSNRLIKSHLQPQNIGQNDTNDREQFYEKNRTNFLNNPYSTNITAIDEKRKYSLFTLTVESIFKDYEKEKKSSSSISKYNDSASSESNYNDSTSNENVTLKYYKYETTPTSITNKYDDLQSIKNKSTSEVLLNENNLKEQHQADSAVTVKDNEYDSNISKKLAEDIHHESASGSNSNYYFSSPEDVLYY